MDLNNENEKTELFEQAPVPKAVMTMAVPTIISSLVMVIYNLADTYFVSMLNNPIQNAAVTLAAPVLLAFNAVNNLFGVGSSSMMSRALGRKDYDTVRHSSAFGFYCALACGILFSIVYTAFRRPLLVALGTDSETVAATGEYLKWTVTCGAAPAILNVVMAYLIRAEGASLHASIGTMSGCILNIILDPIFILPWGLNMGGIRGWLGHIPFQLCGLRVLFRIPLLQAKQNIRVHLSRHASGKQGNRYGSLWGGYPGRHPKSAECDWYDRVEQLHLRIWLQRRSCHGHRAKGQHDPFVYCVGIFPGGNAADQLQLFRQKHPAHEEDRPIFC